MAADPSLFVADVRCSWHRLERDKIMQTPDVTHIARPESVVMLAAQVRAAREMLRRERIDGLKERVSEGGYAVSSKDLAQRVLSTKV
jgi:anti-sigma28 factor (negative regulator of flagellin synthesis)